MLYKSKTRLVKLYCSWGQTNYRLLYPMLGQFINQWLSQGEVTAQLISYTCAISRSATDELFMSRSGGGGQRCVPVLTGEGPVMLDVTLQELTKTKKIKQIKIKQNHEYNLYCRAHTVNAVYFK